MSKFPSHFLIGASTAAHQVEGNNIHSDFWAMEQMENTSFDEPSLDAVDHYNRYREDIDLMANAGLNAYRFSLEWARIEPEKGTYDENEISHYRDVLTYCHQKGIKPIVTMHHFSSPKWLISEGGWENESTIEAFANYCSFVVSKLGDQLEYVCTINEANMGLQLSAIIKRYMKQMQSDVQVGVNVESGGSFAEKMKAQAAESIKVFGTPKLETFLSMRSPEGDLLILSAHEAARDAMKKIKPDLKVGVTLSLHDMQAVEGGEELAAKDWEEEFIHYLPYMKKDDFIGVQNYTRKIIGPDGVCPIPEGAERTQMDYEFYPKALANVIRAVYKDLPIPIMITENGIGTSDDSRRIAFINEATDGILDCINEGIPVLGYLHWSLLDNFEWQKGFSKTFGLIAVDRATQTRHPKESLSVLGQLRA
ncbi:MAG: aryl-beta-glucosidase [Herbinix sp.]|jgi:beta-glucosidase|nr:aryl-beta-glucosidase [Herbinix sp.]